MHGINSGKKLETKEAGRSREGSPRAGVCPEGCWILLWDPPGGAGCCLLRTVLGLRVPLWPAPPSLRETLLSSHSGQKRKLEMLGEWQPVGLVSMCDVSPSPTGWRRRGVGGWVLPQRRPGHHSYVTLPV